VGVRRYCNNWSYGEVVERQRKGTSALARALGSPWTPSRADAIRIFFVGRRPGEKY
jgi:hypothetical protein